jgi:hypothetical protein
MKNTLQMYKNKKHQLSSAVSFLLIFNSFLEFPHPFLESFALF